MGMLNKPDTWKHAQYLLGTFFSFLSWVALVSRTNVRSWDPNVRCRPLWPPLTLPLLPCLTLPPAACQNPNANHVHNSAQPSRVRHLKNKSRQLPTCLVSASSALAVRESVPRCAARQQLACMYSKQPNASLEVGGLS